jgi:hypothetical protein
LVAYNKKIKNLNYMETITATILATVLITVAVIGLGSCVWAIVSLKRRVSKLGGLCSDLQNELQGVYREFDNVGRNHDETIKDVRNDMSREFESTHRRIQDAEKHIHDRVDNVTQEFEKQLDKRFDNVYRKLPKINPEPQGSIDQSN